MAVERAHWLCAQCGLSTGDVDGMIDDCRRSKLDRAELVRVWENTYADNPDDLQQARELCGPCIEAVLDAAGR